MFIILRIKAFKETKISHVLQAIGLDESDARGTIRISFGRFNEITDAEVIAEKIIRIVDSKK